VSWFDSSPETYERARPLYPTALWEQLFAQLPPRPKVLEIGPATGKATGALLDRRATVVACEPGKNLAAFLRAKFPVPDLDVRNETFEEARLETSCYDAVVAATSFHWVTAEVRLEKSHAILRPAGTLAVIDTNQVASAVDRGYFAASQHIYRRYFPDDPPSPPQLPGRDVVPAVYNEMRESRLFERVQLYRYDWDQRYETGHYIELVRSYSSTAQMGASDREDFLGDLHALIERDFGGYVTRPLVITLVAGTRAL
jgi:SAM-dependent methyltransferase